MATINTVRRSGKKRIKEKGWSKWFPEKIIDFSSYKEAFDLPYLLEVQRQSFDDFLQKDLLPEERSCKGLEEILQHIFPIEDSNDRGLLEYLGYILGSPKYDIQECLDRGITYSIPIKVRLRLISQSRSKESAPKSMKVQDVYLGDLPLMTEKGTFIINGAERVIVSQLHRSPGVAFMEEVHANNRDYIHSARLIPFRGSWIEVQTDIHQTLQVIIDNKKKTKMPLTTFFRCFGIRNTEDLLDTFIEKDTIDISGLPLAEVSSFYTEYITADPLIKYYLARPLYDEETGEIPTYFDGTEEIFADTGAMVGEELLQTALKYNIRNFEVYVIDEKKGTHLLWNTFKSDPNRTVRLSLISFANKIRPGAPITVTSAQELFNSMFFDSKRYDLGNVGEYKIRNRFNLEHINNPDRILQLEYIEEITKYLFQLYKGTAEADDIDHLGNRRVRPVGELLQNELRLAMLEIERTAKEKMLTVDNFSPAKIMPSLFITTKIFNQHIKDFFGRSQLSQFLDQTNPLAEITNKRRLSALGPGGLTRDRAGFEVRDVHFTHYGRICPIETPEGQNIGLISSLTTYARINKYGFIETPYRRVKKGKVSNEIIYLSATEEGKYYVAQANAPLSKNGTFVNEMVFAQKGSEFAKVPREEIQYMDVSPKQMVSVSTSLVPFLEHDDANRALMGSNMQRQAVPLLFPEQPMVSTGVEEKVARDSGACIIARRKGVVKNVDAREILIEETNPDGNVFTERYILRKFNRSNQNTCINHRPIVEVGDEVEEGQVLADGPAVSNGMLSLGRNVLVAFMPWHGYNFEDAILISERLVRDDVYTSIYIEELSVEALQVGKLGDEEITREVPNLPENMLARLDERGIIQIGSRVKPGDILVGKITPKGEDDLSAEEKLLRAIFGDKARDMKDTSLRVPSGLYGTVIDVKVFKIKHHSEPLSLEEEELLTKFQREYETRLNNLKSDLDVNIRKILRKAEQDIVDNRTGDVIYKTGARKIKSATDRIKQALKEDILIVEGDVGKQIKREYSIFRKKVNDLEDEFQEKEKRVREGEELPPGVNCLVKVYIAQKRKIKVGDKIAGRHGNKGVISKILPMEDMPFLKDGTPVDVVLNPLGVPSRMNVGQILETHLGWAVKELGYQACTPVFDGASEKDIKDLLKKANLPESGNITLYDGLTGEAFDNPVTVGQMYIMKLYHMVEDKIHARSIGPYALVTQQPLGGRAQYGGQRVGEMEVWAFESYGAAYTLQELLTTKSDDVQGRTRIYESIFKGKIPPKPGIPESFNVLVKELQALAIDLDFMDSYHLDNKDEIAFMVLNESYDLSMDFEDESDEEFDTLLTDESLLEKQELMDILNTGETDNDEE